MSTKKSVIEMLIENYNSKTDALLNDRTANLILGAAVTEWVSISNALSNAKH